MLKENNTIQSLREWFLTCPFIGGDENVLVDILGDKAKEHAIFNVPSSLEYKTYIDGTFRLEPVQTLNFVFASRQSYNRNVIENLDSIGFLNNISKWIYQQSQMKNFPIIEDGTIQNVYVASTGYVMQADESTAKYQIQFKIKYRINE